MSSDNRPDPQTPGRDQPKSPRPPLRPSPHGATPPFSDGLEAPRSSYC